jgi:hypothetical protein
MEYEGQSKRSEQEKRNESQRESQSLHSRERFDREREETTILGINSENLVDGNMSKIEPEMIPQQDTVSEMEIDQQYYSKNIDIRSSIEGREYRRNYQRAYRKKLHEQVNDTERENRKVQRNEQERQRSDRRRVENIVEELQVQSNNGTTHSCNVHMHENYHDFFGNSFHSLQLLFRHQLDSLVHPEMCYICQECYLGIKVRCNRFSASNNMDPGLQPEELANLTQVEEMLISRVSPIL